MNDFSSSYESLYSWSNYARWSPVDARWGLRFFLVLFFVCIKWVTTFQFHGKFAALGKVKSYALILHIIFGVMPKESYAYRITIMEELHNFFLW